MRIFARNYVLRLAVLLGTFSAISACTNPPDLDDSVDPTLEQANYPALVPVEQILGRSPLDPETDQQTAQRLEGRAASLQSRARRLQQTSGIDEETRRRLNSDIETD